MREARGHGFNSGIAKLCETFICNVEGLGSAVWDVPMATEEIALFHGANVLHHGVQVLAIAAAFNKFEAVSWLLQLGADINADVSRSAGPLSVLAAAVDGHSILNDYSAASPEMFKYLVSKGAQLRLHSQSTDHFAFLTYVLPRFGRIEWYQDPVGYMQSVEILLGSTVDLRHAASSEARLLEACLSGHSRSLELFPCRLDVFELLFRRGAPLRPGSPVALLIYHGGRQSFIHELVEAGADVDSYSGRPHSDDIRLTPLQAAAGRANQALVAYFLQKGADINKPALGRYCRTALQAACEWTTLSRAEKARKKDLVEFIIGRGADVDAPATDRLDGLTALQMAVSQGDMETSVLLLLNGADINKTASSTLRGCGQVTALDIAAWTGRLDMVKFFLNAGALSNCRGSTPYDQAIALAEESTHFAVADLIRMHYSDDVRIGIQVIGTQASGQNQTDEKGHQDRYYWVKHTRDFDDMSRRYYVSLIHRREERDWGSYYSWDDNELWYEEDERLVLSDAHEEQH